MHGYGFYAGVTILNHGVGRVSPRVPATTHLDGSSELLGEPPSTLIAFGDPGLDSRIAVLAPGALELACLLMRRGYNDVTIARRCDRPRTKSADLVIVPDAGSAVLLDRVVACSHCMLAPLGTIVIRFHAGSPRQLVEQARRTLMLHGFTGIRARNTVGDTLMRAQLRRCGEQ